MSLELKRELLRRACEMQDQSGSFQHFSMSPGIDADPLTLSEVFAEMVRAGLFVLSMEAPPRRHRLQQSDYYFVTQRGRDFLKHAERQGTPDDVEGFLALVRRDPKLDPYVDTAVAEALWAYNAGHPIASIMCLFAAMERMVRAVDDATTKPNRGFDINKVFQSLDKRMGMEKKVAPSYQAFLSATFPYARKVRNTASHQAGSPGLDTMRTLLCQFVSWYEAAVVLRDNPLV